MIEVELPDGTIAEFPDGTSNDVISGALQKQFGAPQAAPAAPSPDVGTATALGRGAAQGATLGGYDELRGVAEASGLKPDEPMSLGSLIRGGYNLLTGSGSDRYEAGKNRAAAEFAAAERSNPIATTTGQIGGALVGGLGLGEVSLGAQAARAGMGLGSTAVGSTIDGALLGAAQGALSADEGKRLEGAGTGALLGGGIGLGAPLAISAASTGIRRAISPLTVSPERQAASAILQQEGVPLTAGQISGSRGMRYAESELGGGRAADIMEQQGQAFTDAAMRRAGANGLATPDNLGALQRGLRGEFENISARNTMNVDQQFGQDIGQALNRYGRLLEPQQRPIINNITDDLITRIQANGGVLPGREYQAIRSDLSMAANSTNNQALAGAFRGIRNALDNAMERSIPAGSPDAGRWGQLRRQYGNMKVLQRASLGGGEDAGLGIISPARLRMAAASGNQEGFATGASDYTNLAKAGQAIMTPLPQSGTAPRLRVQNLGASIAPMLVGSSAGGAYGAKEGGFSGAIAGALAGAAVPRGVGALMMSRPGQAYLANQLLAGQMSPQMRAIASLLLTNSSLASRNHP